MSRINCPELTSRFELAWERRIRHGDSLVIPAQAGIQYRLGWVPACAGMTRWIKHGNCFGTNPKFEFCNSCEKKCIFYEHKMLISRQILSRIGRAGCLKQTGLGKIAEIVYLLQSFQRIRGDGTGVLRIRLLQFFPRLEQQVLETFSRKFPVAGYRLLHFSVSLILCALTCATGCKPFGSRPISERALSRHVGNWAPDQRVMPYAEINGSQYFLHNIRQCHYLTTEDFVVDYQDRLIDLSQIRTVDFIVVPFKPNSPLAHTMVSFGLDDGTYLCLSVETRRQVGDSYEALAGLTRGYDLIYMLGDERDLIGVRTDHFNVEVYVFPTMVGPDKAQAFFADVVKRMNELKTNPEFYNLISNNCTTNLKDHVNNISPNRISRYTMGTLFTGFSAKHAHKIGLIENRIPFEDLKSICYVNDLARDNLNRADFSQHIRSRRYQIDRELARQRDRQPTQQGRGNQLLMNEREASRRPRDWMSDTLKRQRQRR